MGREEKETPSGMGLFWLLLSAKKENGKQPGHTWTSNYVAHGQGKHVGSSGQSLPFTNTDLFLPQTK